MAEANKTDHLTRKQKAELNPFLKGGLLVQYWLCASSSVIHVPPSGLPHVVYYIFFRKPLYFNLSFRNLVTRSQTPLAVIINPNLIAFELSHFKPGLDAHHKVGLFP